LSKIQAGKKTDRTFELRSLSDVTKIYQSNKDACPIFDPPIVQFRKKIRKKNRNKYVVNNTRCSLPLLSKFSGTEPRITNRDPRSLGIFSDEEQLEEQEGPDNSENPKDPQDVEEDGLVSVAALKMTMMTNPPKLCNSMLSNRVLPRQQPVLTKRGKEGKIE
jgi:hypothetical protein